MFGNVTSALEAESGRLGLPSLDRMADQRTTIVTAHRFATAQEADRIVVMKIAAASRGLHSNLTRQPDYQSCN
ncbi:hypothetical protein [Bradyrhizobium sp. Arg816]|uniref:hypothetical protein n=1 Tax=Bradyrhizobium sp. Arg816 TaxID=2998491 RepID=UPI00249D9120|nr:hypothetical protein [Bradyrhizobium sp. Arg816]MDI3561804.1 hypothetical protein [Bradyrhizobium sp. Arg816]